MNIKLILIEGPNPGEEFELTGNEYTVGRDPANSWALDYNAVSRNHAKFTKRGNSYLLEDLGSSNGTFVNGEKISGAFLLSGGEELGFGQSVKVRFEIAKPAPAEEEYQSIEDVLATKVGGPVGLAKTTVGEVLPPMGASPKLEVTIAGSAPKTYTLKKKKLTFGRGEDNDIVIASPVVSRNHGYVEKNANGNYQIVVLPEAGNAVHLDGFPVSAPSILLNNANIRIGGQTPGVMVSMVYLSPSEAAAAIAAEITFGDKTIIQIGRAPDNDVVLNVPQVSQFHAQIEKVGQRYKVKDLDSTNGTFVNDNLIKAETWLSPNDTVRIGPYRYVMGVEALAQFDDSVDLRVEVLGLNKWVRDDLNILQNISLVFKPREFIVVVGQSGGGKSTLVDALAGYRPATHGQVIVNDTNVYENFEAIRDIIGFVPQKDIIHMELSVFDALDYTAQLRMPPDTTVEERHQRVEEVMQTLDIAHRRDNQILELSGGQQKRVSIGVELLTKPGLFFLDEPSSGLDPGTETSLMHLMRQMADQGRTIILITHATKNVFLADKVVFLARGGYLAWFGPPDEALTFFDQYRSERDRRVSAMEFDQIYAVLEDSSKGTPEEWAERYRQHPAYQQNVVDALGDKAPVATQGATPSVNTPTNAEVPALPEKQKKVSALRQFIILSKRNLRILGKDRFSLGLMLAASPLMGMMSVLLATVLGNKPFEFVTGDMNNVVISLFLLTIYAVMIGGLSQMREIVKEGDIYKRERLVNLKILPYVLSKVWVAAALALYQTATYMIIHFLAFDMPGGIFEFVLMYISLTLATLAGMMLGLFSSALSPTANAAPLIVILLMLPQIVMGGVLVPMPDVLSGITSTNWAFQGFLGVTGVGSDIASDVCMALPPEQIAAMTADDKIANGCNCLGASALREETCYFPGNGRFYNPAIDEALPPSPGPEPVRPADPVIPEAPAQPADQSDTVAVAEYLAALEKYQIEVEAIQSNTKAEFATYEAQIDVYRAEVVAYQQASITHQANVATAIQPVETILQKYNDKFGSAFVNRDNSGEFWTFLLKTWMAQLIISGVLLGGIVFLQKRKDVN
ncbi:MAG: FHA domain-containing protein [Anaerolineae bacterium]|nr:FHA domain-containing protein [Anaerolineae bacterium]MBT7072108.1 FHA domain-containing protein [Anaerolineae bacterium]MBT7326757.1 FHA domain-containing protein [Anaerolineae bacterium]